MLLHCIKIISNLKQFIWNMAFGVDEGLLFKVLFSGHMSTWRVKKNKMPQRLLCSPSLISSHKNQSRHLIIKILGDLTAAKVHGHLAGVTTHQCCFHSSKGFPHSSQTLQGEDEGEFNTCARQGFNGCHVMWWTDRRPPSHLFWATDSFIPETRANSLKQEITDVRVRTWLFKGGMHH